MSFVQLEFAAFFVVVFSLHAAAPSRRAQNLLLILASALFYGWVHPWFVLLLAGSASVDFVAARAMAREGAAKRKRWLWLSVTANVGLLGYFKYFGFFVANVQSAAAALGLPFALPVPEIILPVGISFYTFQTMSYSIDVWRGQARARSDFVDYLCFVSFFPQLVAGPIERANDLLPQLERRRQVSRASVIDGLSLTTWGLFKKVVVADTIAEYVDAIFALQAPTKLMIAAASAGFAVQILADFSGYTDMARGIARCFGVSLRRNFAHPYLARNPREFWQRWHISFSEWIRDYIYIPLGGSRHGRLRTHLATWSALLISGLWHGASWNFVVWGAFHAALLSLHRGFRRLRPAPQRARISAQLIAVASMFALTCIGWCIFRERDISQLAYYAWGAPWVGGLHAQAVAVQMLALTLLAATPQVLALLVRVRALETRLSPPVMRAFAFCVLAAQIHLITIFASEHSDAFIYFQF